MKHRYLVISTHSDDAEVSMGGTISKLTTMGHDVKLLVCIIPCEDKDGDKIPDGLQTRLQYQTNAANILNAEVSVLNMDPYDFAFARTYVKRIDKEIKEYRPTAVFTQWNHDSHQDHQSIANITFAATRKNNVSVLMYEQLTLGGITPYSFNSHVYMDISDVINKKLASVEQYKFLPAADVEAVEALARFRGNQIGVKYAECFEICKVLGDVTTEGLTMSGFW
jgi:N-acetylglucosamine malate deacetylase 1